MDIAQMHFDVTPKEKASITPWAAMHDLRDMSFGRDMRYARLEERGE